jgi:hypothetical protein
MMFLPAKLPEMSHLLEVPDDYQEQEAFRHVTGVIAAVEEQGGTIDDIIEALEARGFISLEFSLGPALPET